MVDTLDAIWQEAIACLNSTDNLPPSTYSSFSNHPENMHRHLVWTQRFKRHIEDAYIVWKNHPIQFLGREWENIVVKHSSKQICDIPTNNHHMAIILNKCFDKFFAQIAPNCFISRKFYSEQEHNNVNNNKSRNSSYHHRRNDRDYRHDRSNHRDSRNDRRNERDSRYSRRNERDYIYDRRNERDYRYVRRNDNDYHNKHRLNQYSNHRQEEDRDHAKYRWKDRKDRRYKNQQRHQPHIIDTKDRDHPRYTEPKRQRRIRKIIRNQSQGPPHPLTSIFGDLNIIWDDHYYSYSLVALPSIGSEELVPDSSPCSDDVDTVPFAE